MTTQKVVLSYKSRAGRTRRCWAKLLWCKKDKRQKRELSKLPITIFGIHGNHEQRPQNFPTYIEKICRGGFVYVEPEYPNLLFAKDGEIYDFDRFQ